MQTYINYKHVSYIVLNLFSVLTVNYIKVISNMLKE